MIFLLGLARKWDRKNQIDLQVPIEQFDHSTWGEIPGKLGYGWTRTYRLFGFDSEVTSDDATITLSTKGEYEYDMTRSFEAPFWYPQKPVVAYNQTYDYIAKNDAATDLTDDDTMLTVNMGGLDVWHQMNNKPKFFQAWQALIQSNELMM